VPGDEQGDVRRARGRVIDRDLAEGLELERLFGGTGGEGRQGESEQAEGQNRFLHEVRISSMMTSLCTNPAAGRSGGALEDAVGDRAVVLAHDVLAGALERLHQAGGEGAAEAVLLLAAVGA